MLEISMKGYTCIIMPQKLLNLGIATFTPKRNNKIYISKNTYA